MIGPVTEPSDEDARRKRLASLLRQRYNDLNLAWVPGTVLPIDGADYLAGQLMPTINTWLAARDEQVAREAVEKALSEVEAEADRRRRATAPGRARMAWGDALRIITAARERATP